MLVWDRRGLLAGLGAAGAALGLPARAGTRLILNDASGLNPTPVVRHVRPASSTRDVVVDTLRTELKAAAEAGRRVAVGAARHSMGGQSLPRDGTAITFDSPWIEVDGKAGVYRVSAGMRWHEVIAKLDSLGFSPKVMQSNADFGVASTFSVNAHGWPVPYGPFGSTVRGLRLMLADGSIVECSREKEPDLFRLAMGGYGLFGVILDLDVEMVRNVQLAPTYARMKGEDFPAAFTRAMKEPGILMAYGRLNVERDSFFREALLVTYRAIEPQPASLPPATHGGGVMGRIASEIYRRETGSEWFKTLRWTMESSINPRLSSGVATRNSLMNEPVANLANPYPQRTDILHEYFVPPDRFGDFLAVCREIIPPAKAEFLNVTLRYVAADPDAVMAFAPTPRIAAVMSFSQEKTVGGEIDMLTMTERLIDGVLACGGSFYLPYRLHARRDQVAATYPASARFVAAKREIDPKLLFRNAMWDAYFA